MKITGRGSQFCDIGYDRDYRSGGHERKEVVSRKK